MYYAKIEWKEERRGLVKLEAKTKKEAEVEIEDLYYAESIEKTFANGSQEVISFDSDSFNAELIKKDTQPLPKEEIAYDIADELYELKEILITLDEVDIERRKRILKKIDAFHINTNYYENGGFELVEMYRKENENLRR